MKYVQNSQQKKQNDVDDVVLFLLLTLNIFYTFSSFFMADFEQLNVNWVSIYF